MREFPFIAHMHRERESNCELTPTYHHQIHTTETRRAVPSRREQDITTAGDCVKLGETGPEGRERVYTHYYREWPCETCGNRTGGKGESVHPLLQRVTV